MNNHDLDKQIREALRTEPTRQQISRLEEFWREQSKAIVSTDTSRRRRIRHTKHWAAAMATTILVAAATSLFPWRNVSLQQPVAIRVPTDVEKVESNNRHTGKSESVVKVESRPKQNTLLAGRAPTAYERVFFAAATRKSVAAKRASLIGKVNKAIVQLAIEEKDTNTAVNTERITQDLCSTGSDVERLLLRRLVRSNDKQKRAVVKLLAFCGTRRSVPSLLRLSKREPFRIEALMTIEQIVGIDGLPQLVTQSEDRYVRAAIFERILQADSELALRGYLFLISSNSLGSEALAAADTVSGPLLQRLLAFLKDDDEGVRLAAAMVLGHANGPEVADSLIQLVMTKKAASANPADDWDSTEAWIAIMNCRGRLAEEFLSYVQYHPKLLGQYNRALARLAQITL